MSEWPTRTLGEICEEGGGFIRTGPFGSQLHRSDYVDDPDGIPVVMPKDMAAGRVDETSIARISPETADRLSQHLLAEGDIALSRRGDVGRSAWIGAGDLPVLCGTGSMRVHPGAPSFIDPDYLRYFFRSHLAVDYLNAQAVGATMPNLNAGIVTGMPVPILPRGRQRFAAAVLRSLDELIENNRRQIEVLEQMAQAIYREWFVHFRYPGYEVATFVDSPLGRIPEGWDVRQLGQLGMVVRGRSYRKYELVETGGLPFINLKCMQRGGGFRRDGLKRYEGKHKPDQEVRHGDIVLAVTDLTQGREILARATLVPRLDEQVGVISLDVVRIVPRDSDDRLPLLFSLRCTDFADRVKEYANGSTVLHLSPTHVSEGAVLWPSRLLRQRFRELCEPTIGLIDDLTDSADRLASIRDLLLPKLVAGQIDVSDLDAVVESVA
jgi:type I restriction enzyme, S subunit